MAISRRARARRARNRRRAFALGLVLALAAGAVFGGMWVVSSLRDYFAPPADYAGPGSGEVIVTVAQGEHGSDIAATLAEADVIASTEVMLEILNADPSIQFQPGSFRMQQQMSARGAIEAIRDPGNRVEFRVTIPEGFVLPRVFERLSESTGIPASEFEAAAADPAALGLPEDAVSAEGWLFPATYTFDADATAANIITTMVARQEQELDSLGVAPEDRQRTLILASIVQREARLPDDFGKVARVFQNRLDEPMPLQSDATVAYGTGRLDIVSTTEAERLDASNPYNTYANPGLPVGPVGAPGSVAIKSVLDPTPGDWLFFVTVDPDTGETVFSNSYDEHSQNAKLFQQWCANNRDRC